MSVGIQPASSLSAGRRMTYRLGVRLFLSAALLALVGACAKAQRESAVQVIEAPPPFPPVTQEEVVEAQVALSEEDLYEGPIHGELSPETRLALVRFQRAFGLPTTGMLDPVTLEALREGVRMREEARADRVPPPRLPPAEEWSEGWRPPPQPPAGALAAELAEVAELLLAAEEEAEAALRDETTPLAERNWAAENSLREALREGVGRLVEARRAGGYALLPENLAREVKEALAELGLLLRPSPVGIGPAERAAIRWLQRRLGEEQTGLPSLGVFEALQVDPAPLLEEG